MKYVIEVETSKEGFQQAKSLHKELSDVFYFCAMKIMNREKQAIIYTNDGKPCGEIRQVKNK